MPHHVPDPAVPVVAIVGAGATGALAAIHLLRGPSAVRVVLVERRPRLARGVAYSTTDPGHLLNVPAAGMSALPDEPLHLVRWVSAALRRPVGEVEFLPRALYGDYLEAVLAEASHGPGVAASSLEVVRASATSVRVDGARRVVALDDGGTLVADVVALATGYGPPASVPLVHGAWPDDAARYAADPWREGALARLAPGPVVLVGSGLTMVDVALTLAAARPDAPLVAVSRHGLLSNAHRTDGAAPPPQTLVSPAPTARALDLLRAVRGLVGEAEAAGLDWRDAMNALRPATPALWRGLAPAEQERALHRLVRFWDVHRHRLAPPIAERIDALRAAGRLELVAGRVVEVAPGGGGLRIVVRGHDGAERTLHAAAAVGCTGPRGGADAATSPLLAALCDDGLARPHPLGLGIVTAEDGALVGADQRADPALVALGPLRRGELFESTAVPEIRVQAAVFAAGLAERLARCRQPPREG